MHHYLARQIVAIQQVEVNDASKTEVKVNKKYNVLKNRRFGIESGRR